MWTSTVKKLPNDRQIVLALDTTSDASVAEFHSGVFWAVAFGVDAYENNGSWYSGPDRISGIVTHWMPLPAPPQGA